MEIRKIEQEDNIELANVIRSVLKEYGVDKPGTVFTDPTTDHLFELFQAKKTAYWIVKSKGKILGGCGLFPTKGLDSDCVELVKLYLLKESRGKGIGKALMELCIEEAKKMGYKRVYLETLPELNNAIDLYRHLNFKDLKGPMGDSGHFACNVWMLREL